MRQLIEADRDLDCAVEQSMHTMDAAARQITGCAKEQEGADAATPTAAGSAADTNQSTPARSSTDIQYCDTKCNGARGLASHLRQCKNKDVQAPSEAVGTKLKCPEWPKVSDLERALRSHKRHCNKTTAAPRTHGAAAAPGTQGAAAAPPPDATSLICSKCNGLFKSPHGLMLHQRACKGKRPRSAKPVSHAAASTDMASQEQAGAGALAAASNEQPGAAATTESTTQEQANAGAAAESAPREQLWAPPEQPTDGPPAQQPEETTRAQQASGIPPTQQPSEAPSDQQPAGLPLVDWQLVEINTWYVIEEYVRAHSQANRIPTE